MAHNMHKLQEEEGPTQQQQKQNKINQDEIIEQLSQQMQIHTQPKKEPIRFQSNTME